MSSKGNSTGSKGRFPIGFAKLVNAPSPPVGGVEQLQLSYDPDGSSTAALSCAATAVARVQDEIDDLWRASMRIENEALSQRFVEVSHALQHAARLLDQDGVIG